MRKGILGDLFDFNRDGQMSPFESGAEMQFIHEVLLKDEEDEDEATPQFGFGWGSRG